MKLNTKELAQNAMIACLYAVLTVAIAPIAYSEIQFRISEVMVFLAFYNKKWVPGLIAGCFIANLASPLGWYDLFFGTMSTVFVCLAMSRLNNRYIAGLFGTVITGVIVGYELHLAFGIPFFINAIYVAIGEAGVLLIGAFLFGWLEKSGRLTFMKDQLTK